MGELVEVGSVRDKPTSRSLQTLERRLHVERSGFAARVVPHAQPPGDPQPFESDPDEENAPIGWWQADGAGASKFVVPFTGIWSITYRVAIDSPSTGSRWVLRVSQNGFEDVVVRETASNYSAIRNVGTLPIVATEGDEFRFRTGITGTGGGDATIELWHLVVSFEGNPQGLRVN